MFYTYILNLSKCFSHVDYCFLKKLAQNICLFNQRICRKEKPKLELYDIYKNLV